MKERPILFSAPMVRAILDGTKTQTRRIMKPQPEEKLHGSVLWWKGDEILSEGTFRSPYGAPSDRLWVKETARLNLGSEENVIQYRADMAIEEIQEDWYSDDPVLRRWIAGQAVKPEGWRPSILMPRRASRITLEITDIRVERLQKISDTDSIAEGIEKQGDRWRNYLGAEIGWLDPRGSYRTLWESINGPGSWDANPWVWVIEFRRIQTPTSR